MTLRHGVTAALLVLAGVGWAVDPPPRLAGRRVPVAASCITLGAGFFAAGVWAGRLAFRRGSQA